jgi:hypothetical protein
VESLASGPGNINKQSLKRARLKFISTTPVRADNCRRDCQPTLIKQYYVDRFDMPASDSLRAYHMPCSADVVADAAVEPPLTPAEREIVKSYGGWTRFLASFTLKPWNHEDEEEGKAILRAFTANDDGEDGSNEPNKS